MVTFLMTLFIILCVVLAIFVLMQQGKGDMGLGSLSNSTQTLFGGSGGQEFFERATWVMGALFIFGSLGLAILRSHATQSSRLADYRPTSTQQSTATEQKTSTASEPSV